MINTHEPHPCRWNFQVEKLVCKSLINMISHQAGCTFYVKELKAWRKGLQRDLSDIEQHNIHNEFDRDWSVYLPRGRPGGFEARWMDHTFIVFEYYRFVYLADTSIVSLAWLLCPCGCLYDQEAVKLSILHPSRWQENAHVST